MTRASTRMSQLMDWRAAIWAGIVAGILFLILQLALFAFFTGGSVWVISRRIAAIVLGPDVLPPPATFDFSILLAALVVHMTLSVIFTLVLAFIIHRWGLVVGIVGGSLFGLALYAINYYTFSFFFPWFYPTKNWIDVVSHVVYGAAAGGLYEALEVEKFVPAEATE